jgi:hypothetical protein
MLSSFTVISSFTTALQLYLCSHALLLFYIFSTVLQLYCCSTTLLFSSFTTVLQVRCCSPPLLLFYKDVEQQKSWRTTAQLENSSKTGEQQ